MTQVKVIVDFDVTALLEQQRVVDLGTHTARWVQTLLSIQRRVISLVQETESHHLVQRLHHQPASRCVVISYFCRSAEGIVHVLPGVALQHLLSYSVFRTFQFVCRILVSSRHQRSTLRGVCFRR